MVAKQIRRHIRLKSILLVSALTYGQKDYLLTLVHNTSLTHCTTITLSDSLASSLLESKLAAPLSKSELLWPLVALC